jgi:hypothetical protein
MKTLSIFRWAFYAIIVAGTFTLLAYILYPVAYLLRNPLRKARYGKTSFLKALATPIWIFLDDKVVELAGDDYGEKWWKTVNGIEVQNLNAWQLFKVAYRWGVIRNPAWNMYQIFKPKKGKKVLVSATGRLLQDGWPVGLHNFAVLKYEDSNGNYTNNQGEFLSSKFSIFGKSMFWYTIENRLYWRFSYAGYNTFLKRWIELHLGSNDRRYTIRFKIK